MTEPKAVRTELVRLRNVTFVLHGGSSEEYQRLVSALDRSVDGDPYGPLMIAKKSGGGWLVIARDLTVRGQIMACLRNAGIPVEALREGD
jgi:hypothetical protein